MPRLEITTTYVDGTVTVEPFIPEPLPAPLAGMLEAVSIAAPRAGRKLELSALDAQLSNRNLTIDRRLELKAALRQAGILG